jgi:cell division septation protein DedD
MLAEERVDERVVDADEAGGPAPPPRPSYGPVAALLLGLVVAVVGGAFYLDGQLRPSVGIEPAAVTALATEVTRPPAAASQPTATTVPTAASAAPTTVPPATATPAAADKTAAQATASALPSSPGDLFTPLEKEIIDAYLRYWDVRIGAYYEADPSRLTEVMAGAELAREQSQIEELRKLNRAARIDVEHNFRIRAATSDSASVYDEYINRSRLIDGSTKRDLPETEGELREKVSFELRRVGTSWKVVDGARHD